MKETKPATLKFTDKSTTLYLNLADKKASRFNGVLGFLPQSKATDKLIVTGEAKLKLLNSFGRGELIDFNWRSLQPRTQDLNVNLVYPFLLSTPFGADLKFKLYKRDTLYLDVFTTAALQYLMRGGSALKVFVHNKETRVLGRGPGTAIYSNVKSTLYGMGYKVRRLDYALNPRKGFSASIEGAVGGKRIKNDPDLNPDSVDTRSVEYEGIAAIDGFVPLAGRHVLHLGLTGGHRSSKSMFVNELYRLGGLQSLRGFDEETIFASSYVTYLLEYRYLLEQNSFLYAFFNGAYYENEINRVNKVTWVDTPFGYGAGITFETKAGIFSVNYALGQQLGNPADLKAARVHFGIVSSF
ncbi:MAG: BamA/TamA family outer membrane protein [Flavobacteriales bacterium]|nr:BamA/TamA family outer membrane protein [Flavobacteriales bacterium]